VAAPAAVPSTAPVSVLSNDEKWAEVLKNLPAEIRVYVDTDKVPQVAFAPKPNGGTHVTLTFDVPMSQHAFALAVSTDSEGNRAKVPVIVQKAVRKVFEPTSTIAPSPQTASGEIVKKVSQLSTEEQAAVKRQIALASSGLNLGTAASLKKPEPKVEPAVPQPASQPAPQPIVQPAPVSDSSVDRKPAPSPESFLSPSLAPTPGPSGHELSESVESASSSESSSSSAGSELDDDDPWADEPDEVSNAAETAETAASAEPSDSAEPKKSLRHIIAGGTPEADGSDRHVDPEDDVYSVTDESLGNSEILSVAELAKRFDVKEIREIPKAEE
jgi:DNA polymerase-3 subunit gamma/tau